ncbi:MAG: riboflavin synthase [Alphaproteobacteria bacterium]
MFTGIISDLGRIRSVAHNGDTRIVFETAYDTASIDMGASIACSGVCLTVVDKGPGWFGSDLSAETLARTTAADWQVGTAINLERSLKLGDELGGHLVYGHVDGVGVLAERQADGDSHHLVFQAPVDILRFIAVKGSIAVDGVSLTVNRVDDDGFEVTIIPHTARATTLGPYQPGTRVNLEIDMLARYVQRLLAKD